MTNRSLKTSHSDDDFLKAIVSSVTCLSQAMPNQMMGIKNTISEHIFCSAYLAQLIGIDAKEIIGKKVWLPLYDNDSAFEAIMIEEDQTIMKNRSPVMVIKINRFHSELMPYTAVKSPLINPSTNNVVGILFQGFEMGALSFRHYLNKVSHPNAVDESNKMPNLSKREKQVIFFFLANLSSQEIAEMLYKMEGKKVSKSTIDSVFNDQLYTKFNVHSRPALYKTLQTMGYEKKIPKELLTTSSIILNVLSPY